MINLPPPERPLKDIFLFQDPTYVELQAGSGWRPETRQFLLHDKVIGAAVLMRRRMRLIPGEVMLVLFGPKLDFTAAAALEAVLQQLIALGREFGCLYVAVQPYAFHDPQLAALFEGQGFKSVDKHILYRRTVVIDLKQSEAEIFAAFKNTVRSSIKRSERDQVEIRINESTALDHFYELYRQSYQRGGGAYQPKRYFETMWRLLAPKREALFAIAYFKAQPVTAGLFGLADGNMIYLSGGTTTDRQLLACQPNEKLHWDMIRLAKSWGCGFYDMGGANPQAAGGSKSASIASFKLKFGQPRELLGFFRYDIKPARVWCLDRLVPWVTKIRQRLRGPEETDYNLF